MANKKFWLVMLVIVLALGMAGCSRAEPKDLAQQTYDLTMEIMANPIKAAGSMVKAASIARKVSKLSPADKQIYNEELARLTGQEEGGLGSILGSFMGADNASIKEALNAIMEAIGELNSSIKNNTGNGTDAKQ